MSPDISKSFSEGFKAYAANFRVFILISLTGSIPSFFSNVTPDDTGYDAVFLIAAVFVELWAMAAVLIALDRAQNNIKTGVTEAFDLAISRLPRFLGYSFLYALVLIGGFAALILPGLYLWPKYMFVQFEALFGEAGTNPFTESSKLSKGNMMTLFITMFLVVLGITLLTYLPELVQSAAGISDESTPASEITANILGTSVFPWLIASVYFIYKSLKPLPAVPAPAVIPEVTEQAPVQEEPAVQGKPKKRAKRAVRKK